MHDVRLVGVHEDGEHLLLSDPEGARYMLPLDEALRAAVRRDRTHLGQLQIEIDGGLRPRDVQARIRAGATAEEVAALAGWTVEKVRRYEGPVLAERAHVTDLARAVRVRLRGVEPVALGALVAKRLTARSVDADRVRWDAWRPDQGPWVLAATFPAGGRERQAQWTYDAAAGSISAADDEARWLSQDEPAAHDPLTSGSLTHDSSSGGSAGRAAGTGVYDVEADGGVAAEPRHDAEGGPLDLVSAMRSRRRGRDAAARPAGPGRRRTGAPTSQVASSGSQPSDVPGSTHPAGRRRPVEPLDLDPTLMDDPPAAHPPAAALATAPVAGDQTAERQSPQPRPQPPPPSEPAVAKGGPEPAQPAPADVPEAPPEVQAGRGRPAAKRSRRTSVPAWDDIMFGAKRD